MAWKVRSRGDSGIKTRLRALSGRTLAVGLTAARSGSALVQYAAANEFGVPGPTRNGKAWRVPPRPYLRSTLADNKDVYETALSSAARRIASGGDPERELGLLGLRVVADVQRKITKLRKPPNAPSTIRRKGSSNPLIDTGRLRASITYVVRRRARRVRL